jgi:hypothetical protein
MNKTCRGCNNELDNCTCNVLTTEKERAVKLKPIVVYNPCIQCEFEHDGECFDIECPGNTRYNASVLGAKEQLETDQLVVNDLVTHIVGLKGQIEGYQDRIKDLERINESHQKLNSELQERIKELEALIPTKEEAKKLIVLLTEVYVENYDKAFRETAQSGFAKLQKIAGGEK